MAGIARQVVFGLAVWRASKIVTEEEGPFMVFSLVREAVSGSGEGVPLVWEEMSTMGKLLNCPYCISVWFALALYLLFLANRKLYQVVAMSLFGSGVTALIEDYYGRTTNS